MQNIHPWFVHFPIALFVSSLLFGLLALILRVTGNYPKTPSPSNPPLSPSIHPLPPLEKEGWGGLGRGISLELENVAKWIWWLGTLFAVITVGTGWQASNTVAHSDASHEIMELHGTLGWVILVGAVLFSLWKLKAKPEWEEKAKTFTLLFQVVLVSILAYSAHLGGKLVYEFGIGTALTATEKGHDHQHDHKAHDHKTHDHSHKSSPLKSPSPLRGEGEGEGAIKKYVCPMKCEGEKTYSKPGHCPVCNMHLTLKN